MPSLHAPPERPIAPARKDSEPTGALYLGLVSPSSLLSCRRNRYAREFIGHPNDRSLEYCGGDISEAAERVGTTSRQHRRNPTTRQQPKPNYYQRLGQAGWSDRMFISLPLLGRCISISRPGQTRQYLASATRRDSRADFRPPSVAGSSHVKNP